MGKLRWYKRDPDAALGGMMGLTLEERGAYNTVLDLIYSHSDKLPDDDHFVAGWCQVDVRVWKRIKSTLVEKDKLRTSGGLLTNFRATSEIIDGLRKIDQSTEAGRKGGRKTAEKIRRINGITPATDQATDAKEIERPLNTTTTTTRLNPLIPPLEWKSGKRAVQFPNDWKPKQSHAEQASRSALDVDQEAAAFEDYHRAKGSVFKDWDRAFNTWLRNASRWATDRAGKSANGQAGKPTLKDADLGYVPATEATEAEWRDRLEGWKSGKRFWPALAWGDPPDQATCKAPKRLIAEVLGVA